MPPYIKALFFVFGFEVNNNNNNRYLLDVDFLPEKRHLLSNILRFIKIILMIIVTK